MAEIEALEELARDASPERRQQLLRAISDMFFEDTDRSTSCADLFAEVVNRVLDDVVEEARLDYANHVAAQQELPRTVALKLATDCAAVAMPVLQHSPVLTDEDLVSVANNHSNDHLLAISLREKLASAVTDILIECGEENVVHSVAGNQGAQFSKSGLETLAGKAASDENLKYVLVERHDLSADVIKRLEPVLDEQLRQRLHQKGVAVSDQAASILEKARQRIQNAFVDERRESHDAEELAQKVRDGAMALDEAILHFTSTRRAKPLARLLASVAGQPEQIISKVILKLNGMPIAMACKAVGVSPQSFREIVRMRNVLLHLPDTLGEKLCEQYEGLDPDQANHTMRLLRVRQFLNVSAA